MSMRNSADRGRRGVTLLEVVVVVAILVPVLAGILAAMTDSWSFTSSLGETYQLRSQANFHLEAIALRLEQGSINSPDWEVGPNGLTFNVRQRAGGADSWSPEIVYAVSNNRLMVTGPSGIVPGAGDGSWIVLMSHVDSFETSQDGNLVTLTIDCGTLSDRPGWTDSSKAIRISRAVVVPD